MSCLLSLNGRRVESDAATLADLLANEGYDPAGAFACAVNRQFVPRAAWAERPLADGDQVDVVAPVTGG
jgi:sulfur carrier protein